MAAKETASRPPLDVCSSSLFGNGWDDDFVRVAGGEAERTGLADLDRRAALTGVNRVRTRGGAEDSRDDGESKDGTRLWLASSSSGKLATSKDSAVQQT
jgi:hypothetical protein